MKNTQKVTRVKLALNQKDESILLGIVSAEPDYKLSLLINNKFNISLRNNTPIKISDDKSPNTVFSRFSDLRDSPHKIFNLVSNRSGNNFLFKKLINIDYILLIHDTNYKKNTTYYTLRLREIETITAVFDIDLSLIKDQNLEYLIQ